jgi:hypothetical protein
MRDRLVELISQVQYMGGLEGQLADYLLKNGVIVPPCKVGQTVYQTDGIRIYELEIFDVSLRKNKPYYETESIDFDGTAIGKSIFLTREEAERALERSNNE